MTSKTKTNYLPDEIGFNNNMFGTPVVKRLCDICSFKKYDAVSDDLKSVYVNVNQWREHKKGKNHQENLIQEAIDELDKGRDRKRANKQHEMDKLMALEEENRKKSIAKAEISLAKRKMARQKKEIEARASYFDSQSPKSSMTSSSSSRDITTPRKLNYKLFKIKPKRRDYTNAEDFNKAKLWVKNFNTLYKNINYKQEDCISRFTEEKCKYGNKCQFAHNDKEKKYWRTFRAIMEKDIVPLYNLKGRHKQTKRKQTKRKQSKRKQSKRKQSKRKQSKRKNK